MALIKSLRVDAPIDTFSAIRAALYVGLIAVFIMLAWRAELVLSYYVILLVVSAAVLGYLALAHPIVLHISQPPLDQRVDKQWQILMRTGRGDVLWQADLLKTHCYHLCIHFEFSVIEPYQRPLSLTVFRDQVSAEGWRELNILANVIPKKTG